MARFKGNTVEFPELKAIQRELKVRFDPRITAKFLGAALNKAAEDPKKALQRIVRANHKAVTGNLYRSITKVVRRYPKSGNAVGLVGFNKAGAGQTIPTGGKVQKGKDRAFHQGLIVFGTKERRTKKSSVASSFWSRGPFRVQKTVTRGKNKGQARLVTGKYPFNFMKRAPKGQKVSLGRVSGTDPIKEALNQSAGKIRESLRGSMSDIVERAARYLEKDFPAKNT